MLAIVKSYALDGLEGMAVQIEVDVQPGIPGFDIVGLPSSTVKEARNRVRSAIRNTCFEFAPRHVTVNMAPADIKKEGTQFDFPIAVGFLAGTEQISSEKIGQFILLGELSLDGRLRKINGILPILIDAYQKGHRKFIIPAENAEEAAYVKGIEVYTPSTLSDAVAFLGGLIELKPLEYRTFQAKALENKYDVDFADVRGQSMAKRAIEIAVAGGHNILMCGPPGSGKSMLAKCIPTIMPNLSFEEALETTKIHSIAGILDETEGIVTRRPFRSPHHTASVFSLTGGGKSSMPGEISLAHNGVLFLDEMPEYNRSTLETLRQPMEDGFVVISRVARTVQYPCRFMLVASMNPCPCGYHGADEQRCNCTRLEIRRYQSRISGPLLDRIDLFITLNSVGYDELRLSRPHHAESSAEIKARVERAREIQRMRFRGKKIFVNSEMSVAQVDRYCILDSSADQFLFDARKNFEFSARASFRIVKIARTIADLRGAEKISLSDIAEAVQYRKQEVNYV